ncbi:MAG: DNA replication/repair protein RecF [Peptococcaceae bacterium]|nr:DNA replication/repair protein RecF [Peptococcaceae bacterium]
MIITELQLINFRNYKQLNLHPDPNVNILFGFNAQGKTNLLEAIYCLATTRSSRNNKDRELISWDSSYYHIKGTVQRKINSVDLEIDYQENGQKLLKIAGIKQTKLPDYIGALSVVLFSPEELVIVKGGPKERRKFLDLAITQVSKSYTYLLIKYSKVVEQRNFFLKGRRESNKNEDTLEIWDAQLVSYGSKILHKRFEIIRKMALLAKQNYYQIAAGKEKLEIKYLCSISAKPDMTVNEIENWFIKQLLESKQAEFSRGMTLVGPHRDDLIFYIDGAEARLYGSQGQQRTIALALKLAELEIIKGETGEYPVLLLDDVLSELDNLRRHYLITAVQKKLQTFITTTNLEFIDSSLFSAFKTIRVDDGKLFF